MAVALPGMSNWMSGASADDSAVAPAVNVMSKQIYKIRWEWLAKSIVETLR